MRLIFIPGFGETHHIFNQLAPDLPGEKLFINNRDLLGSHRTDTLTVIDYARRLVEQHGITRTDVVIGHSMGGWVAQAIKYLIGCRVVQIASWTDPKKVLSPVEKPESIYWLVRRGWLFNPLLKALLLRLRYRNQPSAAIFSEVFQNLIESSPDYIINQLRVILTPVEAEMTTQPDLRIHSKKDSIIRFPDQSTVCVPGDHFNLVTDSQEVSATINEFLRAE